MKKIKAVLKKITPHPLVWIALLSFLGMIWMGMRMYLRVEAIKDTYTVYGYCACEQCCGDYADGITYTGTVATKGRTIAVDPDIIPLGSCVAVYLEDFTFVGYFIAEDTGTGIDNQTCDLFFDTHEEALQWGVEECRIFIYEGKG